MAKSSGNKRLAEDLEQVLDEMCHMYHPKLIHFKEAR